MESFPFKIAGLASRLGRIVPIDEWAKRVPIPHRSKPDTVLSGADIVRILGIQSKSWDPELFRDFGTVRTTALAALKSAGLPPAKVDGLVIVTCTPYEVMLDQDAFRLARELQLPDHVVPMQINAGCAGLLRAANLMRRMATQNFLVVTYNIPSLFLMVADDRPSPAYLNNGDHPSAETLWASPAIFSDGAAAVVFERDEARAGAISYSRDAIRFGDGPGFTSPLVTFLGGGARCPPGSERCAELSCFAMEGEAVKQYYVKGMLLNHADLRWQRPGYAGEVRRLYVHQSSPALVRTFVDIARLDASRVAMKADQYGNLVSASTLRLVHEDLAQRLIDNGDEICISVVGAGPERGALLCRIETCEPVAP
ncbi:MAG: hypothetical protein HY903_20970 [Deltaproteobacteria bacterium]|nr:hypothetical protein [Deltaproteobacteria bacterium]